jgi:hypothetical protein
MSISGDVTSQETSVMHVHDTKACSVQKGSVTASNL